MENKIAHASYIRVSTSGQEKSGLGLQAQRSIIANYFGEPIREFLEVKSGKTISERPVLTQAIDFCLENNLILTVAKVDRLSRNVDHCRSVLEVMHGNIRFGDIPGTPDKFTLTLFAAFSERERDIISMRTTQALQAKLKRDGKWQKGTQLFISGQAYKLGNAANKAKASTNENNIRAAQVIRTLLKEGKNKSQIARILNEKKFKTANNFAFCPSSISRFITNFKNKVL